MKQKAKRVALLIEREDHLLQQVEASQYLLTAIIKHIEKDAMSLNREAAQSVAKEAHRQFANADQKLLECRLQQILERRKDHDYM
jgi:hypothetical protein